MKDKLTLWILSGISNAFSKMNHIIRSQTLNNTNARESVYTNVNYDRCNLSLLVRIVRELFFIYYIKYKFLLIYFYFFVLKERDFNKRQWESTDVYEQYNVPDTYQNKSELARSIHAGKFMLFATLINIFIYILV